MKYFIPYILFFGFLLGNLRISAQEIDNEYKKVIQNFIDLVKQENIDELKKWVHYPFTRPYPLDDIQNENEFVTYYPLLFDDNLTQSIIQSDVDSNWGKMGYNGFMLNLGQLWLDTEGKLIAVNQLTKKENKVRNKRIKVDKKRLYKPLRNYIQPKLILETDKYKIRIDEVEYDEFRLSVWEQSTTMKSKPLYSIRGGEFHYIGSIGNCEYIFTKENKTYSLYIDVIRSETHPVVEYTITSGNKELEYQKSTTISY